MKINGNFLVVVNDGVESSINTDALVVDDLKRKNNKQVKICHVRYKKFVRHLTETKRTLKLNRYNNRSSPSTNEHSSTI